jgi:hypothetical protein
VVIVKRGGILASIEMCGTGEWGAMQVTSFLFFDRMKEKYVFVV